MCERKKSETTLIDKHLPINFRNDEEHLELTTLFRVDGGGRIFSPITNERNERQTPPTSTIGNSINFYCNFITFNYCFENDALYTTVFEFSAPSLHGQRMITSGGSETITQLGL